MRLVFKSLDAKREVERQRGKKERKNTIFFSLKVPTKWGFKIINPNGQSLIHF